MLSNPVAVSCVAYKCFVDHNGATTDGVAAALDGAAVHDANAIIPASALQPIIAELRALDTACVLDQPMNASEALQSILGEPLRAGLSNTLRSVVVWQTRFRVLNSRASGRSRHSAQKAAYSRR